MATPIDSLFLELGIDTSKFSADQQRALAKIAEFESKTKHASAKAAEGVKTVGKAFRSLADESSIGGGAKRIETLAQKITWLGRAAQVSGGLGTPLGGMAKGLGALLSPAALGVAALGLLGKGVWDLNEKMTATNATIFRQSQLSDISAKSLWAWGETAKTVGANPQDIAGGITALKTAVEGAMIGAGDATPQLISMARLGVRWNAQSGPDISQLFERVHTLAKARNYKNLGALRALTGPLMNDAMFSVATNPTYDPAQLQRQIQGMESERLGTTLQRSLKSQAVLGTLGIQKDVLAETAYGDTQGLLQGIITILTSLLGVANSILNGINALVGAIPNTVKKVEDAAAAAAHAVLPGIFPKAIPQVTKDREALAMRSLMEHGASATDAEALVGNFMQESGLNPLVTRDAGAHLGIAQWDKTRQAQFAKQFGYQMGSSKVSPLKQLMDQLAFVQTELATTQSTAAAKIAMAGDLAGKTRAVQDYYERPGSGDLSFLKRFQFAQQTMELVSGYIKMLAANERRGVIQRSTVTHHTRIGEVNVNAPQATNATGIAAGIGNALSTHPLLGPLATQTVTLATRGSQ